MNKNYIYLIQFENMASNELSFQTLYAYTNLDKAILRLKKLKSELINDYYDDYGDITNKIKETDKRGEELDISFIIDFGDDYEKYYIYEIEINN